MIVLRSTMIAGFIALFGFSFAYAQTPGGGPLGAVGPIGGPALHAKQETPDVAPPALPGASEVGNISAGPVTTTNENPTKLLFSAINHGDYTQARAAVSRGANLNARNALDETPIELAVELNRNNITFMLLSVRAEEGPSGQPAQGAAITPVARSTSIPGRHVVRLRTRQTHLQPAATMPDQPAVPNPSAGFLGFGGHS